MEDKGRWEKLKKNKTKKEKKRKIQRKRGEVKDIRKMTKIKSNYKAGEN
jgi:hypothetical protein